MRQLLLALTGVALIGLAVVVPGPAEAQQDELCEQFQSFIDMGMGTPFEAIALLGQDLKDAACDGDGDDGNGDDGNGDDGNPVCDALHTLLDELEGGGAPAELIDPVRELISQGCPQDDPTTTTTAPPTTTTAPAPTTTTTLAVEGQGGTGGTATPATGGLLTALGLGGTGLLALAAFGRRFLG